MSPRNSERAMALYRPLLFLLPPAFRRDYGDLMLDAFGQLLREYEHGRRSSVSLGWLVLSDFLMTFGREWETEFGMWQWWRDFWFRLLGLSAMVGAAGWFVVFIAPEWEPFGDLGWGHNGFGYRPNLIVAVSFLLVVGLLGGFLREASSWSRLHQAGMALFAASAALIALQALVPMGGVSFATTPAQGLGVYLLPVSIAVLAVDWARRDDVRWPALRPLRAATATAVILLALGLLLPIGVHWFDMWDFVVRHAFLFPGVWLAFSLGYRMAGGPGVQVSFVRPARPGVA